jgi:hypothetical protein
MLTDAGIRTANMGIGLITPPVGLCLCVACGISGAPIDRVTRPLMPLLLTMIATLFLLTFFPDFVLFCRDTFGLYRFVSLRVLVSEIVRVITWPGSEAAYLVPPRAHSGHRYHSRPGKASRLALLSAPAIP